jgi:exopolyphosphatase / guanosine-5'-triphosphate,3'-diphosphate pyrophosphatase
MTGGPKPQLLAAIDVGTNSFHLVIARVASSGRIEVITREREMVRLGKGAGEMKELDGDAMDRGISALRRMKLLADGAGAPLRAVATSAVREATNASTFVARARDEAGVDVEVVSGMEEARLIHLGVLQALPVFDRKLLLCDIGGGSTELLLGHKGEVIDARSFKIGAVRLTDRFFAEGRIRGGEKKACRAWVRSAIAPFQQPVERAGFEVAIASSGSAETVARLSQGLRGHKPLRTYNGYEITADEIHDVCELLANTRPEDRAGLDGMDPKRADISLAGALILDEVVNAFGIQKLVISDFALREGILLDTVSRIDGDELHHLRDISRRGVRRLLEECDDEPAHAQQVARLATALFDATQVLHGLPVDCREYLEAGALLANVGLFISHSKHHLHSYYMIRNSDALAGLTDAEIDIIALVARYHRKGFPKNDHAEFARLRDDQKDTVRTLAGILRVAIGLDRRHDGRVTGVRVERTADGLKIVPEAPPATDLSLELYAADERSGLLAEVLGTAVILSAD